MNIWMRAAVAAVLTLAVAACDDTESSSGARAPAEAAPSASTDAGTRQSLTDDAVDAVKAVAGDTVEQAKETAKRYAEDAMNEGKRAAGEAVMDAGRSAAEDVMDGEVDGAMLEGAVDEAKKRLGDWQK